MSVIGKIAGDMAEELGGETVYHQVIGPIFRKLKDHAHNKLGDAVQKAIEPIPDDVRIDMLNFIEVDLDGYSKPAADSLRRHLSVAKNSDNPLAEDTLVKILMLIYKYTEPEKRLVVFKKLGLVSDAEFDRMIDNAHNDPFMKLVKWAIRKTEGDLESSLTELADFLDTLPGAKRPKKEKVVEEAPWGSSGPNIGGTMNTASGAGPSAPQNAPANTTQSAPPNPPNPPAQPQTTGGAGKGKSGLGRILSQLWHISWFWSGLIASTVLAFPTLLLAFNLLGFRTAILIAALLPVSAMIGVIMLKSNPLAWAGAYWVDQRFLKGALSKILVLLGIYTGVAVFMYFFPLKIAEVLLILVAIQGLVLNQLGKGPKWLAKILWAGIALAIIPAIFNQVVSVMDNTFVSWIQLTLRVERRTAWVFVGIIPIFFLIGLMDKTLSAIVGKAAGWLRVISIAMFVFAMWQVFSQPNQLFNPYTGEGEFKVGRRTGAAFQNLPRNARYNPQNGEELKQGDTLDISKLPASASQDNLVKQIFGKADRKQTQVQARGIDTVLFDKSIRVSNGAAFIVKVPAWNEEDAKWTPPLIYTPPLYTKKDPPGVSFLTDVETELSAYVDGKFNSQTQSYSEGYWRTPIPEGQDHINSNQSQDNYFVGTTKMCLKRLPVPYYLRIQG